MEVPRNRQRFIQLAEKRVNKALKDIRLIGNLSNRSNYAFSESDYNAIIAALNTEIRDIKRRFTMGAKVSEPEFKLPNK